MVAHVCVFLQLVIEYFSYREKIQKWRKEQQFDTRYKTVTDESETAARKFIENNSVNGDKEEDEVKEGNKKAKLTATYFTATYFGLMKKNKKEYKLKESD